MNTNRDNTPADDFAFDRLVDGELGEAERRDLLAGLDDAPNGWRRCALAFLESQCWKQTLGPMTQKAAGGEFAVKPIRVARSAWRSRMGTLVAMAASFLLAFWVGSHLRDTSPERRPTRVPAIGEIASTAGIQPAPVRLGRQVQPTANPWKMVTVSAPSGSENAASSMRLPAVERDNIDQQWLRSVPPAMPDDVQQAFRRSGHQVEQNRELVPVPLQDGRQMVVPVDNVKVRYVGNGTY
jgi:hypothetical protein